MDWEVGFGREIIGRHLAHRMGNGGSSPPWSQLEVHIARQVRHRDNPQAKKTSRGLAFFSKLMRFFLIAVRNLCSKHWIITRVWKERINKGSLPLFKVSDWSRLIRYTPSLPGQNRLSRIQKIRRSSLEPRMWLSTSRPCWLVPRKTAIY